MFHLLGAKRFETKGTKHYQTKQMYKKYTKKWAILPGYYRKIGLIMRFTTLILAAACMQLSAASFAQKITLSQTNAPLKSVFKELRRQSGYDFVCTSRLFQQAKPVDIHVKDTNIEEVLRLVFTGQPFTYIVRDKTVVVHEKEKPAVERVQDFFPGEEKQQHIGGIVTDEQGNPLPGVSVVEKGTINGTVTNAEGEYSIDISKGATLVFSSIGFITSEVVVGSQSVIDAELQVDINSLDEVVVVGYGVQKKVNMTASVVQIDAEELGNVTSTGIGASLQGRLPGLYIRDAGYNQQLGFLVRGQTTIGQNSPLFIVDGIEQNTFNIDPNDIETISILKDGAASAIYGARAAAGVVLITTKTGRNGKIEFNYETFTGWSSLTSVQESMNSVNSAIIMNEAAINSGGSELFTAAEIALFQAGTDHYYADTKWTDEVLKTERTNRHYLSASGGNEKTSYLFSLGYKNDDGIMGGIDKSKYTLRSNIKTRLHDNLEMTAQLSYTILDNTAPNVNDGIDNIYLHLNGMAPYLPVLQSEADGGGWASQNRAGGYVRAFWNPFWELEAGSENRVENTFVANTSFTWEIIKGLKYIGRFSGIFGSGDVNSYIYKRSTKGGPSWWPEDNQLYREFNNNRQLNAQNFLSYEKQFGDHSFGVLGGWDVQFNKSSFLRGGRQEFQFDELLTELDAPNSGDKSDILQLSSNTSERALQSAVARINYSYAGKYLLEMTGRYDGSSNFAPETRYGFFPAISVGWMMSDEGFFNTGFFDYLKLRASYGSSGNNRVQGSYFSPVAFSSYYFGDGDAVALTAAEGGIPFRGLRWEVTTTSNIGIEFSILERILSGEIDIYNKITDDILLESPVQGVVGTNRSGPAINAGKVRNSGIELILTHRRKITEDLSYSITLNGSYNKNKIVELTDAFSEYGNLRVGDPLGSIYGYINDGILSSAAEAEAYTSSITSGLHPNTSAGDISYRDVNGDGILNFEDQVLIGETIPRITGGLRLQSNWKNFDLQIFFQGVGKAQQYNFTDLFGNYGWIPVEAEDRWSESNTSGTYPRPLLNGQLTYTQNFYTSSDYWVFNAAYLRLKNIQLGYTFPLPENKFVDRVRVYFTSTNPWTASNFRPGFDPEANGLSIPPLKSYILGLNVEF